MKRTIKKRRILINPTTVLYTLGCLAGSLYMFSDDYVSLYGKILFAVVIAVGYFFFIENYAVSYFRLSEMEAFLGIDFDEEMAKRGVTRFHYKDYDWYINSYWSIMYRNFVEDMGTAEKHRTAHLRRSGIRLVYYEVPILCSNGREIVFRDSSSKGVENWYKNPPDYYC